METPLSGMADAFEELALWTQTRKSGEGELQLDRFCNACSLVSVLLGCLELAFKFAELENTAKVHKPFLYFQDTEVKRLYNVVADQTAEKKIRRYIEASGPVIEYIDSLYIFRKISLDW